MVKFVGAFSPELVSCRTNQYFANMVATGGHRMVWTTPTLVEVCIGLEINGYLPAEF
jgi:coenzyme PQQ precursor peptide PqqA